MAGMEHDSHQSGRPGRAGEGAAQPEPQREWHPVTLCPADAAALDAILAGHSDVLDRLISAEMKAAPPVDPARMARVEAWLQTIGTHQVAAPPADLLERTLAAVQADRMRFPGPEKTAEQAVGKPRAAAAEPAAEDLRPIQARFTRRMAEYGAMAVAACVLMAVLIPGIGQVRQSAKRTACANNLGRLGAAFEAYAVKYGDGQLPMLAIPANHNWLARGVPGGHSNTANLLPLVRENYVAGVQALACPGRGVPEPVALDLKSDEMPDTVRGYSYASMFAQQHPKWDRSAATIVLADRNPLFTAIPCRNPHTNSFNHSRLGNYVLRASREVSWEPTPDVGPGGDNIWTVGLQQCRMSYSGTEEPVSPADVFLAP